MSLDKYGDSPRLVKAKRLFTRKVLESADRKIMLGFIEVFYTHVKNGDEIPRHWLEFVADCLYDAKTADADENNDRTSAVTKAMRLNGKVSNMTDVRDYLLANMVHYLVKSKKCKTRVEAEKITAEKFGIAPATVRRIYHNFSREELDGCYELDYQHLGEPIAFWENSSPEHIKSAMSLWPGAEIILED